MLHMQVNHGTHGTSALARAQGVLNAIVSLVYDGLCQWLNAAMNTALAELVVDNDMFRSSVDSPQSSFVSLSSITDGDLLIVATPPPAHSFSSVSPSSSALTPSLRALSSDSSPPPDPTVSSLAMLHTNIMNERIRGIFIELFARSLGMDGSVMAVSAALALIDAPPTASASTAQVPSSFPPISLLALIEQETLAITTDTPQALVASLASKATAAASAATSLSLLATNNNTAIVVKHYIGDVTYSLADIIESNRMTLSASTQTLVASSSIPIVRSCLDAVLSQVRRLGFRNLYFDENIDMRVEACVTSVSRAKQRPQRQLDPLRNSQGAPVSLDGIFITSSVAHHKRHAQNIAAALRSRR